MVGSDPAVQQDIPANDQMPMHFIARYLPFSFGSHVFHQKDSSKTSAAQALINTIPICKYTTIILAFWRLAFGHFLWQRHDGKTTLAALDRSSANHDKCGRKYLWRVQAIIIIRLEALETMINTQGTADTTHTHTENWVSAIVTYQRAFMNVPRPMVKSAKRT